MQDAFQNAPRRLTRRCTSPAAANAAPYATRSPTSRSRPPPVIAATASIPAAARRPTRCCSRRDRSRCCAARPRSTATAAVRAAPSCAASARTVARRYSAAPRAPTTTWSAPARWTTGSLPRAGQPVDRLGAVLAPHRCRRAQFSRQCATDSLRPTRYAAAKQKGRVLQDSPFLHATSGLPWRAVHLCMAYCTTCASLPEAYWAAISVSGRALILLALPAVPNSV